MIRRHLSTCAIALALPVLPGARAAAQDVFTLGFSGPDMLTAEGGKAQGLYNCTLSHSGSGEGARAWSLSMTALGGKIEAIDLEATTAATLYKQDGGFAHHEITTGEGNEGAVSAVVLDFLGERILPTNGTSTIARLRLGIDTTPAGAQEATLRYQDGLRGLGEPVRNVITQAGSTASAAYETKVVTVDESGDPGVVTSCPVRMLDKVTGELEAGGSDAFAFPVLAGTLIDVKLKLGSESPTFGISLLDPSDAPVDLGGFLSIKKQNVQIKKLPLSMLGAYTLVLEDSGASANPYLLQLKGKAPKTSLALSTVITPEATGLVSEVEFTGLEGATLSGALAAKKGTVPVLISIQAPSNALVPFEGSVSSTPSSVKITNLSLPETGVYTLSFTLEGVAGPVKVTLKEKVAKGRALTECAD